MDFRSSSALIADVIIFIVFAALCSSVEDKGAVQLDNVCSEYFKLLSPFWG